MPRTYPVSYITGEGPAARVAEYEVEALSISDMVAAAMRFMNVRPGDNFERFRADLDAANEFANFVVAETIDDTYEWCDPRGSFRDLHERWLASKSTPTNTN